MCGFGESSSCSSILRLKIMCRDNFVIIYVTICLYMLISTIGFKHKMLILLSCGVAICTHNAGVVSSSLTVATIYQRVRRFLLLALFYVRDFFGIFRKSGIAPTSF